MGSFNLKQALNVLSLRMAVRAAWHPIRVGYQMGRVEGLRGLALWRRAWRHLRKPSRVTPPPVEAFLFPAGLPGPPELGSAHAMLRATRGGALRIEALASDLLRVRWRADGAFPPAFSYSVVENAPTGKTRLQAEDASVELTLQTAGLTLGVQKATVSLNLADADGRPLLTDVAVGQTPEGWFLWQAAAPPEMVFYGLGEKTAALNLAGRSFELWNCDPSGYDRGDDPIYMSVPFWMGLIDGRAVGVFYDNAHRAWIDFGESVTYRTAGGEMRFYVMVGTPARVLEQYTLLTGRMALPPLWALGLHQSRWSYYPEARVRELATEYRRHEIPCDAIHLDIHYLDDYRCFTWNRERFPEPKALLDDLHAQGFKVISIIDPGIKIDPGYAIDTEGLAQDAFVKYPDGQRFVGPVWPGDCHFPDFTDPAVREWWGGLYAGLLEDGLDAFWNDMNEPALITRPEDKTLPDSVRHDGDGHPADHAALHNVYGMLMARASVEGLARLRPERRPFILSRAGWAGLQRYAAHWTADNKSTWDHLRLSIQMVLNLGLSGIPLTGPDVGGFTGEPSPELFARWVQVGAFMPFFRIHSMIGSPPQEPWTFGPDVEVIARRYIEWRYRLLPYLYTAVWQAAQTGMPIARALSLVYPDDPATYTLDDEFLFGDSLLVAPVVEEGATSREVYLPAGGWVDFWTGEQHDGPRRITRDAPLDTLPLFARAGSVIPLWPVMPYVSGKRPEALALRVYLGEGESTFYEDDGESPAPAHRLTAWHVTGTGFSARATVSGYDPVYERLVMVIHGLGDSSPRVRLEGVRMLGQHVDMTKRRLSLEIGYTDNYAIRLEP
jgi:alpha-glucosidase